MTPCVDIPVNYDHVRFLPPDEAPPRFCAVPECLQGAQWRVWIGGTPRSRLLENAGERLYCCNEHLVSDEAHVQYHYLKCRLEGTSHKLAEMFAFQQGPALMTDAVFLEGRGGCYDQFQGSPQGDFYGQAAKEAGLNTTGKVYLSGLAAYPGDPRAWVSGRGDVQRVCEERGWDCDGSVRVRAARFQDMAPPSGAVADDLVEARLERELQADPGLLEKPRAEVKEEVREMITPAWAGV